MSDRNDSGDAEVQTEESYYRRTPALVESGPVLSATGRSMGSAAWLSTFDDPSIEGRIYDRVREHPQWAAANTGNPLVDVVEWAKRAAMFIPGTHLVDQAREIHRALLMATMEDTNELAFPGASILAVRRSPTLLHRVKLQAVLLRVFADARLRGGDTSELKKHSADGNLVFGAGNSLTTGVMILDAYLLPLLAALTPHVWAFPVLRINGTLLCSFGRAVSGASQAPSGLLDTLHIPGRSEPVDVVEFVDPSAPEAAVHWWAGALNQLFGVVTDPVTFADKGTAFDVDLAFQTTLTVEQVFRRVGSSQMADGDVFGRRAAMFNAIDALEGLLGYNTSLMLSPDHARKILERLEAIIPAPAAEILLPAARRAVAALEDVAAGFYLHNADGTIPVGPGRPALQPRAAAAKYMYLLRNSTHGFSGGHAHSDDGAALLGAHTGDVHHDVGLLGWLYIVDLLSDPARLRRILSGRARR
ncbi:hypothetical protein I598_0416 [Isoptericola dokdonensis DS-3]|jgi:hypothetical protein|uniref:Uncharacterized protein n=2 Tax=Isoptericola TaxID=254250 RepID=A0A161IF41_9MICO|nr:hypothetical protein I598_0416 [Isoptericola dokdonensis DS-3]